jgi:hypothetical protein
MNMKNKLVIMMVFALIVVNLPLSQVMGDTPSDYTVTVMGSQNTALQTINTNFGTVQAGTTNTISPSFNLTNVGNQPAQIDAKFTTFNGTVYGLDSISEPIGAANFSLKDTSTINWVALSNDGSDQTMTDQVAADAVAHNWDAKLIVPAGQAADSYTGTIELIFSNIP